ncbi:MAG: glycosyltransferase family A protein [Nitratireductor sp.]
MTILSVCICTCRRAKGLDRLLQALSTQIGGDHEVVVVNDGSHDNSYGEVTQRHAGLIRYVVHESNEGIAKARKTAALNASGEFLVYIDDDCVPPAWWLDWLQARLDAHPELDIVAGPVLPLPPDSGETFRSRMQGHFGFLPKVYGTGKSMIFPTANVCIRRQLMMDIGMFGFPGPFFGAGEDTEFAVRAQLAGARMFADNAWHVRHEVGEPMRSLVRRYYRYGYSNGSMIALSTSPEAHDYIYTMRYSRLHEQLRHFMQMTWTQSKTFQGSRFEKTAAFVAALFVHMVYQFACIRGMKQSRRKGSLTGAFRNSSA